MTQISTQTITPSISLEGQTEGLRNRPVAVWLFVMCALIALMVAVGGATRLTDSGLSITEWKPVTGAIPPMSEAMWLSEFEKYQQIPEYEQVNWGMSLAEFKTIYWWEWGHRFLGRVIGLAFLFPLIAFAALGRVGPKLGVKLGALFVLGGAQGALGWWMVSSGLTERVDVSQYRLAAHLGLAIALYAAIFWLALETYTGKAAHRSKAALWTGLLALGVYGQIILGAFVAGMRAGLTYNTWPLMDGRFFPKGYLTANPSFTDLFETIEAVQFNHRFGAYLVVAGALLALALLRRTALAPRAGLVVVVVGFQMALGIAALLNGVPLWLGLAHQIGALVLLTSAIYLFHGASTEKSKFDSSGLSPATLRGSTDAPSG